MDEEYELSNEELDNEQVERSQDDIRPSTKPVGRTSDVDFRTEKRYIADKAKPISSDNNDLTEFTPELQQQYAHNTSSARESSLFGAHLGVSLIKRVGNEFYDRVITNANENVDEHFSPDSYIKINTDEENKLPIEIVTKINECTNKSQADRYFQEYLDYKKIEKSSLTENLLVGGAVSVLETQALIATVPQLLPYTVLSKAGLVSNLLNTPIKRIVAESVMYAGANGVLSKTLNNEQIALEVVSSALFGGALHGVSSFIKGKNFNINSVENNFKSGLTKGLGYEDVDLSNVNKSLGNYSEFFSEDVKGNNVRSWGIGIQDLLSNSDSETIKRMSQGYFSHTIEKKTSRVLDTVESHIAGFNNELNTFRGRLYEGAKKLNISYDKINNEISKSLASNEYYNTLLSKYGDEGHSIISDLRNRFIELNKKNQNLTVDYGVRKGLETKAERIQREELLHSYTTKYEKEKASLNKKIEEYTALNKTKEIPGLQNKLIELDAEFEKKSLLYKKPEYRNEVKIKDKNILMSEDGGVVGFETVADNYMKRFYNEIKDEEYKKLYSLVYKSLLENGETKSYAERTARQTVSSISFDSLLTGDQVANIGKNMHSRIVLVHDLLLMEHGLLNTDLVKNLDNNFSRDIKQAYFNGLVSSDKNVPVDFLRHVTSDEFKEKIFDEKLYAYSKKNNTTVYDVSQNNKVMDKIAKQTNKEIEGFIDLYKITMNQYGKIQNPKLAAMAKGLSTMTALSSLGGQMLSAFTDISSLIMHHGFSKTLRAVESKQLKKLSGNLKFISAMQSSLDTRYSFGEVLDLASYRLGLKSDISTGLKQQKLKSLTSEKFQKLTGMTFWDDNVKDISCRMYIDDIVNASINSKEKMFKFGFKDEDINNILKSYKEKGGEVSSLKYLDLDNLESINKETHEKVVKFLLTGVEQVIIKPTAGNTPRFLNSDIGNMLFMYNKYMAAYTYKILKPAYYGLVSQDRRAGFFLSAFLLAPVMQTLKEYHKGKTPEYDNIDFYKKSFVGSGLLPFAGDKGMGVLDVLTRGPSAAINLMPAVSKVKTALELTSKLYNGDSIYKTKNLKKIKSLMPFGNLIGLNTLVNVGFDHL